MEGQRVKSLTEGYLRGWLNFEYPQAYSRLREEIVLSHIQADWLYDLLKNKLMVETVIRSSFETKNKELLAPIVNITQSLIGLKLPSLQAKDTIEKEDKQLSKEDLSKWKKFLETVNKK